MAKFFKPLGKSYSWFCDNSYTLQKYLVARLFIFGVGMGFLGVKFSPLTDGMNYPFVGKMLLLLSLIGLAGTILQKRQINLWFGPLFGVWNLFLIDNFIRHGIFKYIGLYTFFIDLVFSIVLFNIYLLHDDK